jgi:hypothetical protein
VDEDVFRIERVVIETGRHRIVGDLTLPREGMHSRVTDLLNREGLEFVPLVDVLLSDLDGDSQERLEFVAVARDHIHIAYEAADVKAHQDGAGGNGQALS